MTHLLLKKIKFYEKRIDKMMGSEDADYSPERGMWVVGSQSIPLIEDSKRPLPSTKKHDVERGEDLK